MSSLVHPSGTTGRVVAPETTAPTLVHPYYVLRVAGEPAELVALSETGASAQALRETRRTRQELLARVVFACDALAAIVPALAETDPGLSRRVLELRRDLHNLRVGRTDLAERLGTHLQPETVQTIRTLQADIQALQAAEAVLPALYEDEVARTGVALRSAWQRKHLQEGLSLSSPDLFRDALALLAHPERLSPKKRRGLEDTLLQYLSRCSTKTSPLSSFTLAYVGRWLDDERDSFALSLEGAVEKRVEVKTGLVHHLLSGYLRDYARVSRHCPLELNGSIQIAGGKLSFLHPTSGDLASGRTFGSGEERAELNLNPIVQCVLHVLGGPGRPLSAERLVAGVCALAPKLQPGAVSEFLGKLFEVGLLLPATGLRDQQDLLPWALGMLRGVEGEAGTRARAELEKLGRHLGEFAGAAPPLRAALMGEMHSAVLALEEALGSGHAPSMAVPVLFENCYYVSAERDLSTAALEPFQHEFELLLELALLTDPHQEQRCNFADFFLARFGAEGVCERPVELLEQFDEIYGVARYGFVPDAQKTAPRSPVTRALLGARSELRDYLAPRLASSEDVRLEPEALARIAARIPRPVRQRGGSYSFLVQRVAGEGQPRLVLNQVFGGRSALLSRFLEGLPEEALEEVRAYLRRISRGEAYAEIPAVFGFNANRHPRLAPAEVSIPPYPPHFEETEKIPLADLRLVYDPGTHSVCFLQRDGSSVDILYQGFLIPPLLPHLQRVLAAIGTEGPTNYVVDTVLRRRIVAADRLTVIPRVTLGQIVVSRRTYLLPRSAAPRPELSPFEFFRSVQSWRDEHGLPNEAFVRTSPTSGPDTDPSVASLNVRDLVFKDLKPFYVKLDNPRLVRLLARAMSRNEFALSLTEVLPSVRDQHVQVGGRAHVAELHFELSLPPPPLQGGVPA